jgi:hypothetical protein
MQAVKWAAQPEFGRTLKMTKTLIIVASALLLCFSPSVMGQDDDARSSKQLKRAWWNTEARIEALELDQETRARMDAHAKKYLLDQQTARQESKVEGSTYTEAMRKGDWVLARETSERLASQSAKTAVATREFKIRVLMELSDAQREAFYKGFPRLVARQWVRAPAKSLLNKQDSQSETDQ